MFVLALLEEPNGTASRTTAFVELLVILLILVANSAVGVIQETNAEKVIDVSASQRQRYPSILTIVQALKEYSPHEATVLRSGKIICLHASELVPGDIVSVAVGIKIPADCRLVSVSSNTFRVDQAIFTCESMSEQIH